MGRTHGMDCKGTLVSTSKPRLVVTQKSKKPLGRVWDRPGRVSLYTHYSVSLAAESFDLPNSNKRRYHISVKFCLPGGDPGRVEHVR